MVIHFFTAIGAVQKSGQWIGIPEGANALRCFAELLRKLPCLLIYNGLMGVLKDQPVLFGILNGTFILVELLMETKIDRMPHILRLGEDLSHNIAAPVIGIGKFLFAFPDALALLTEIHGGCLHLIIKENAGDIIGAFSFNGQTKNAPHHSGSFLVDQPMVFVFKILLVAIDGAVGGRLAGFSLDADCSFLLAAQVTKIPLVHDVEEGSKFIAVLIVAVHAVGDGDKVDAMLPEEYLRVKSGLQIVSPRPAHILDDHMGYLACFNIRNQLLPGRSLEITAAPSVVRIYNGCSWYNLSAGHSFPGIFFDSRWSYYPRRYHHRGTAAHRER